MMLRRWLLLVIAAAACNVPAVTFTDVDCRMGPDCASGVCVDGECVAAACTDRVKNGDEADVDCGGACGPCLDGAGCGAAADCTSSVCTDRICQVAACDDGVKNGDEADLDCGGACRARCGVGQACGVPADCASNLCPGNVCADPSVCATNPKWQAVDCATTSWVWTSNRTFTTLATANAARVLETGCAHSSVPNTCSTDGRGWVSTQVFTMAGCDTTWFHITPADTFFNCAGHDGDQYRHLSRDDNSCYDY